MKALFGLSRSGRLWQERLQSTLFKIGFTLFDNEPCFLRSNQLIVFFYVDDILFRKEDRQTLEECKEKAP